MVAQRKNKQDKNGLDALILYYLPPPPPLESAQTKHRRHCLRPLDAVFMLGLGATMTMAPVRASGRQRHGVTNIDTLIECRNRVTRSRVPVSNSTYVGYSFILRQAPIRSMKFWME
jgi:hypothetical protein